MKRFDTRRALWVMAAVAAVFFILAPALASLIPERVAVPTESVRTAVVGVSEALPGEMSYVVGEGAGGDWDVVMLGSEPAQDAPLGIRLF